MQFLEFLASHSLTVQKKDYEMRALSLGASSVGNTIDFAT